MNRRRFATAVIAVAVIGPIGGLVWFESRLGARLSLRPEVGTVFPALPGLADGESLPASPGRLRVVTFARAGCGNCDRTLATFRRLAAAGETDLDVIAVVAGSKAVEPGGPGIRHAIADPDGSVSRRFGVVQVPLVFLVDEHSRIRAVTPGDPPEAASRSFMGNEGAAP